MAKLDKDINIPKGPQRQSEDIREALMQKVKQQQEQQQSAPNVEHPQFNNQPQIPHSQATDPNRYAGYGTYSSPFNNSAPGSGPTMRSSSNLIDAIHANEAVQYKPKKRKSAARTFIVLFIMIALILSLSWALRELVFQAYEIPSGSMEKTIMTWDMVFAEKVTPFWAGSDRGDIVTFDDPVNEGRVLIKRVIATQGQTVDIKNNKLYIDGVEQDEPYTNGLPTTPISRSKITYPYTVPEGCVWLMGDNRTNSQDSRYFGAVPQSAIIGQALFIYWPFEDAKLLV